MTSLPPAALASCPHSELAVGWALYTLEPAEEVLVAAHLPDCSECTRAVEEAELVGAVLGLSVPEAVPSAELEQRVLAIATLAQDQPAIPPTPSALPAAPLAMSRATGPSPSRPAALTPRRTPPRRYSREPFCVPEVVKLIAVALLVLALASVIVFYVIP